MPGCNPMFLQLLRPERVLCYMIVPLAASLCGSAQGVTLGLSSGSGSPGSNVTLNMSLSGTDTNPSAALEWILVYSPADFSSASVATGPAAIAASKFVSCTYAPGISKCVLWGINATGLSNGVVATVSLTLSTSTTNTSSAVQFALAEAADAVGTSLAASGSGGIVTIP